jgi:hypothetical protein
LTVDLGSPQRVVGFVVRHAGDGGENAAWNTRDFAIETSTDETSVAAAHWASAVTVTGNVANVTFHSIAARQARYARLKVNAAQSTTDLPAARIYEFEVHGIERQ